MFRTHVQTYQFNLTNEKKEKRGSNVFFKHSIKQKEVNKEVHHGNVKICDCVLMTEIKTKEGGQKDVSS